MTDAPILYVAVRNLIVFGSFIAIGALGWKTAQDARALFRGQRWRWSYVVGRTGVIGALGLILESVYNLPAIEPTWRAWLYVVCLAMTTVGYVGIVRNESNGGAHE